MEILLVRHSIAVHPNTSPSDDTRELTDEGRRRMKRVVGCLSDVTLTRIYTSPLVRAVQTAEILATMDSFEGSVHTHLGLVNEHGGLQEALAPIHKLANHETVAMVGHEPKIRMVGASIASDPSFAAFQPGEICAVTYDANSKQGELRWRLDPEALNFWRV